MLSEHEIWHLKRLNFFPSVTEEELKALIPEVKTYSYKKGDTIYFEGERADYVYLVKEGYVRLSRLTPEGRSLTLDIFNPGDIFGELVLAGEDRRSEIAEAQQNCTLWLLPKSGLQAIVEQNPKMALQITKIMGFRRLQIENKISNLLTTVPVRLARLIISLAERYPGTTTKGNRYIKIRLTHRDLGDLIAANREIVTATLNRFKKDETITFVKNMVVLLDEASLRDLAGLDKGEV
jgi:CRP/FNR family transcriptional regulator